MIGIGSKTHQMGLFVLLQMTNATCFRLRMLSVASPLFSSCWVLLISTTPPEGADEMSFLDEAGDELELEFFALEKSVVAEIVVVRMAGDDHTRNIFRHPVQEVNFASSAKIHYIF
ncbi:hypothetical protein V6N11_010191 [Hibiscus sabdariffa]|uniref:Uncharacterized protein n=1 Tax=Hibiscus sabdariffa TaxID=183260 RepID=A0ABR2PDZ0_9ROSI